MFKLKTLVIFLLLITPIFAISVSSWTPQGNISMRSRYGMYNATNITITSLKVASCDVKANVDDGALYCGTDNGGTGDTNVWTGNFTKANVTQTTADNATIAANLSSLNDRINTQVLKQSNDNATIALNLSALDNLLRANNRTIETNLTASWDFSRANNRTIASNLTAMDDHFKANNRTIAANLTDTHARINLQATLQNSSCTGSNALNSVTHLANGTQVQTCIALSASGDGGGNATASSVANFFAYSFNATHFIQSLMSVAGNTLRINYTFVNVTSTLFVNGVNVTGRQAADNATIASNLTTLFNYVRANNDTLKNNASDTYAYAQRQATLQNASCSGGLTSVTHLANGTFVTTCGSTVDTDKSIQGCKGNSDLTNGRAWQSPQGACGVSTTANDEYFRMPVAGTAKKLSIYCNQYGATNPIECAFMINGANSSLKLNVSSTGLHSNDVGTASVAANDNVSVRCDTRQSTLSILNQISWEYDIV